MAFMTKLDFSDNRQVRQNMRTSTQLSGATIFGVTFDELAKGPDLTTSAKTQDTHSCLSTFVTKNGVTTYNWYDKQMKISENSLSAITPSMLNVVQTVGATYIPTKKTLIDGNEVNLEYFAVEFDIEPTEIIDLGNNTYSGTVISNSFRTYTASGIDFKERTIWVDVKGITRTQDLILTRNPSVGKVWTCINEEGKGEWRDIGSSSVTNEIKSLLGLSKKDLPLLIEAPKEIPKEIVSAITTVNNTILNTQTILAEDNNIDLNYNGTIESALGGGITILHGKGENISSELKIDKDGNWLTNNDFKSKALTIPFYTPNNSSDINGNEGNITRDDNYLYIKTINGWKRSILETF